jgi:hypothetical protein
MKNLITSMLLLLTVSLQAQTVTVDGTPMLVSSDTSFPFWLQSGASINPEPPVASISVLEFNIVAIANGNDMVFNQVLSISSSATVPEGKTWKVESVLQENQSFEVSNANSSLFIPTNSSSTNIVMDTPVYDSLLVYWTLSASILPSAGSPITERGFCYSVTNEQPTVYDNITSSGSGTGSFEELFNNGGNLEANTTYYFRSYATSLEGITYSDVQNFITTPQDFPEVGNYNQGGIVFYIDETGEHGLVAATEDLASTYEWGCYGTTLSGADGQSIGTGLQNTLDIVSGCSGTPIAASLALAYQSEGYSDWYLPSKDELTEMYNTIGNGGSGGNIGGFSNSWYWSSSENYSNNAWTVDFYNGNANYSNKANAHRVRVIRAF